MSLRRILCGSMGVSKERADPFLYEYFKYIRRKFQNRPVQSELYGGTGNSEEDNKLGKIQRMMEVRGEGISVLHLCF